MEKRKKRIDHSDSFLRKKKAKQQAFLAAFKKLGLQGKACEEVDVSHDAVADWREADPDFERAYLKAELRLLPRLHDVLIDRVMNGIERGVYHKGDKVATEKDFSDKLLLAAIAARDPRYRNSIGDQPLAAFQPASITITVVPDRANATSAEPPKPTH